MGVSEAVDGRVQFSQNMIPPGIEYSDYTLCVMKSHPVFCEK
jgi:hypothetical protein